MSSLLNTEQALYDFLENIMREEKFNVFRGTVPKLKHKDREMLDEKEIKKIYPCVILRIISTLQVRENLSGYISDLTFEIVVGTKNEDYLENMKVADYIKDKLLDCLYSETGFVINQNRDFKIEYYNDEYYPFIFSKIVFTLVGTPVFPNINIVERLY